MKYYVLLLVFLLGCQTNNESIIGLYNSEGQTFFSNAASFFSNKYRVSRSSGLKLIINSDSSFVEKRCKIMIKSKWNINNDTLFLKSDKFYFYEDSINNNPKKKNKLIQSLSKLMKYNINTKSLEKIEINRKGKRVLTKYVKAE